MNPEFPLLDDFFMQAREIHSGQRDRFDFPSSELLRIATEPVLEREFKRRVSLVNDPSLKELIVDFVDQMAEGMDESADKAERKVDLLDRAGLSVAGSVTAAGVGTTIAAVAAGASAGAMAGPLGLLLGGIVGLVASAWGRDRLKGSENQRRSWAKRFRRLIGRN